MVERKIIGFSGRQRSGKDVMAKALQEKGYTIVTIANALKELCAGLLGVDLQKLNELKNSGTTIELKFKGSDIIEGGSTKEYYVTTVRELLQIVGTDIIRSVDPDWHVKKMLEKIRSIEGNVVVDDIRFPNELEALRKEGADVYFIVRTSIIYGFSNHSSETALTWNMFPKNNILINDGTLIDFRERSLGVVLGENENIIPGLEYNTDFGTLESETLLEVIKQNEQKEWFKEEGIIKFSPKTIESREGFVSEVCKKLPAQSGKYVVYSPLIYENLKKWIKIS